MYSSGKRFLKLLTASSAQAVRSVISSTVSPAYEERLRQRYRLFHVLDHDHGANDRPSGHHMLENRRQVLLTLQRRADASVVLP
jgi:hypothetical protein